MLLLGIVGKPSSGKSTFLNATCLSNAKVSELPFTTIEPNRGVAYVKTPCVCQQLNVDDNPQNSLCKNGERFIPINLLDVAGLVPDAHNGKGLGNQFLNDLSRADALIHIVDASGSLDKTGKRVAEGSNDPYEDIIFLENEIDLWFKEILEREDWKKFTRSFEREKRKFIDALHNRLSGLKINKKQIIITLKNLNLMNKNPSKWNENDLLNFTKDLRNNSKPILIAANKIDKEISLQNFKKLKERYSGNIIPCSALAEYILREYDERNIINYIPGSTKIDIIDNNKLNEKELGTIQKIKDELFNKFGGTGIQKTLNVMIFDILDQICVYPVSDVGTYSDKSGNILPDVFLIKKGTKLKQFIREKIHTDLADNFMFGIDAKTKRRLGEDYILKHNDVIKIVTS